MAEETVEERPGTPHNDVGKNISPQSAPASARRSASVMWQE